MLSMKFPSTLSIQQFILLIFIINKKRKTIGILKDLTFGITFFISL